jgi:tRNA-dihydrouridine synthase A
MAEPQLVAECMAAIGAAVRVPATVKCRLGVDDQDPEDALFRLVDLTAGAGVTVFVIHARKAWLAGLSPKENRELPPLDYGLVRRLKRERPALTVVLNGGVGSLDEAQAQLAHVDGVMLGRAAYHTPAILGEVDRRLFGEGFDVSPEAAVAAYLPHVERELTRGTHLAAMTRHMLGLFPGRPGARAWRRILTVEGARSGAGVEVIERALAALDEAAARLAEPAWA